MKQKNTYQVNGKVVLRRIGEDCLLVPVRGPVARESCVFPVNETGVFIWERLSEGQSLDEIAEAMTESFAVAMEDAVNDCRTFVDELVSRQLVEEGES